MTTFSPPRTGNVDILMSSILSLKLNSVDPSWGTLLSAMFIEPMILTLETSAGRISLGRYMPCCKSPSILYRTRVPRASGPICISVTPLLIPVAIIRSSSRTTGGSDRSETFSVPCPAPLRAIELCFTIASISSGTSIFSSFACLSSPPWDIERTVKSSFWLINPRLKRIAPMSSPLFFCSARAISSCSFVISPASISRSPIRFRCICNPPLHARIYYRHLKNYSLL